MFLLGLIENALQLTELRLLRQDLLQLILIVHVLAYLFHGLFHVEIKLGGLQLILVQHLPRIPLIPLFVIRYLGTSILVNLHFNLPL
jgi:hypothetical protein